MIEMNEIINDIFNYFFQNHRIYVYTIWCYLLEKIISRILSRSFIPKFQSLEKDIQEQWFNRSVNLIHSGVMFSRALYYWIFLNPSFIIHDQASEFEKLTIDLMVGFLIYDTIYVLSCPINLDFYLYLLHHFLALLAHVTTRMYDDGGCAYYK